MVKNYVFLTASAGQIRTKRAVFVKESSFKRIEQKLMCGLTIDKINERGGMNQNKFLAYLALMNSATDDRQDAASCSMKQQEWCVCHG